MSETGGRREPPGPGRPVISAGSPADLVAAVPYLVGFVPTRSLVLLSLRGERRRFGVTARVDLPGPRGPATVAELAATICEAVLRDRPREVLALVYDEQGWDAVAQPWRHLVDAIQAELGPRVALRHPLYVTGTRYWGYTCHVAACCPPHGMPVQDAATTSAVAAAYVLEGRSPATSRGVLVRRLAVRDPARAAQVLASVTAELAGGGRVRGHSGAAARAQQAEHLRRFDAVAGRYVEGGPPITAAEAVALLVALHDVGLRDVVVVRWTRWALAVSEARPVRTPRHDPDPADEQVQHGVTRLLTDLSTSVDGEPALTPLTLLAMHSWSCGDGAQAGVALDRALAIDDRHRLARLVDTLLRSGVAPSWVAPLRAEDESPTAVDPAC